MSKSPRLVFFGNERLATGVGTKAPVLRALVQAGYEIAAVVANHTDSVSRKQKRIEIVEVAHAYHIPVLMPASLSEIAERLEDYKAEAAVLVAYGKLIPKNVIELFPKGIINLHPSLLPKYRGPTPIEAAILAGDSETGVSIMGLTTKMDAGPVFAQAKTGLSRQSKQQLAEKLGEMGAKLMLSDLPKILDGSLKAVSQNNRLASYTKLLKKEDGVMDFGLPAKILERQVRAYAGWPRSASRVFGQKIIVTSARVAKSQDDGPLVMRARGSYLEITELIGPSGKTMSGADFIRGYASKI